MPTARGTVPPQVVVLETAESVLVLLPIFIVTPVAACLVQVITKFAEVVLAGKEIPAGFWIGTIISRFTTSELVPLSLALKKRVVVMAFPEVPEGTVTDAAQLVEASAGTISVSCSVIEEPAGFEPVKLSEVLFVGDVGDETVGAATALGAGSARVTTRLSGEDSSPLAL